MHVFVTGATGWVGSAVTAELLKAGHQVTGLARSDGKAAALAATGARVYRATLDDTDALRSAAAAADAVVHTAFNHDWLNDFSRFAENSRQDQRAIEALAGALEGSERPLLVTAGLSGLPRGATEADAPESHGPRKSEETARSLAERGARVSTIRLAPSVHGPDDWGFIPMLVRLAREKRVSAYIGDGQNCWSGVYRGDAAKVYRLAVEQGATERVYHAVADEAVPFKDIAEVVGRRLGVPVEPREPEHFGWFAMRVGAEMAASSARTRSVLDWRPTGPSLLADIDQPSYYSG